MGGYNLNVETLPSQSYLALGQATLLDLQVKITTTTSTTSRGPLNLVLILDRSGSMASERRLENAKLAIKNIIQALGKDDLLHLVTYSGTATTVFSGADLTQPQFLLKKVDELTASGGTNLEAGLEQALAVVKAFPSPPPRFFIFSDGQVNAGKRRSNEDLLAYVTEIHDNFGIKMSSFGLGKDFNEDLMTGIAEHGMGLYSFIEGSASMDSFVSHSLQGIIGCVATEAVLTVESVAPSKVEKIFGYKSTTVALGDLTENNVRQVIAQVRIPAVEQHGAVPVVKWSLSHRITGDDSLTVINGQLDLQTCEPDGDLKVNEDVQTACLIAQGSDYDARVLEAVDQGRAEDALLAMDEQIALLRRYNQKDKAIDSLLTQCVDARSDLQRVSELRGAERDEFSKLAKKKVAHQAYQKRRGSISFIEKNRK